MNAKFRWHYISVWSIVSNCCCSRLYIYCEVRHSAFERHCRFHQGYPVAFCVVVVVFFSFDGTVTAFPLNKSRPDIKIVKVPDMQFR